MAVCCPWATEMLVKSQQLSENLPIDLRTVILNANGAEYLDAVASALLVPSCTERIFAIYRPLVPDLASRWSHVGNTASTEYQITVLLASAKILPFAQYLRPQIKAWLRNGSLHTVLQEQNGSLPDGSVPGALNLLLALFRLLSSDIEGFQDVVKPSFFSAFLSHSSLAIRYLAVECLCLVMHFADDFTEKLIAKHAGEGPIIASWEGKDIDYRLLKLFEEQRWVSLSKDLDSAETERLQVLSEHNMNAEFEHLLPSTAVLGNVLIPRHEPLKNADTNFVNTATSSRNLSRLGQALLDDRPIILRGPGGSGKTALITELARLLNRQSKMIVLHLNEQTDAKSLLGIYTSSASGESFSWQPGVLTRAIQQGFWLVIEDINRAPSDILSVFKPIIEKGSLFLSSRKQYLRPAEGFRLFATMKSSSSHRGQNDRQTWLADEKTWNLIQIADFEYEEMHELLRRRYPHAELLLPQMMVAHQQICLAFETVPSFRSSQSRVPTLRDLIKWCRRVNDRVSSQHDTIAQYTVQETFKIVILQDAIDCYAGYHAEPRIALEITQRVAQAMNVSPQQLQYLLSAADINIQERQRSVALGRSVLPKAQTRRSNITKRSKFAMTTLVKTMIDRIAAAVTYSEPVLLVGETGVGKTTVVQYVARLINQNLTVVNLSQQSEATDLLGGLKPITTRTIMVPFIDQFETLFNDTFSTKRNEKFWLAITKAIDKQNWSHLLRLWQEAIGMAESALTRPSKEPAITNGETHSTKRRKITTKFAALQNRWIDFSSRLDSVRGHIKRGDKNHTFAFVEGRLVQAVRNGEWILLDEINLASADTLDHIASLLKDDENGTPSLLLTEAGDIERVVAHPEFRIFAAMNPATDTGKKDLAPGIRSRFTEIYVPSGDSEISDLVQIIESYLGAILNSDQRAAFDLARSYVELRKLNQQHKLTDGAGDVPHFSIRSLVRCLLYVIQHAPTHGLRRALFEGFTMSFFTVLSQDTEQLVIPIVTPLLLSNIKNTKAFLFNAPKVKYDVASFVAFQHHLVRRGPLVPDLQPQYIRTPSVEKNLINLARATSMQRFPVLLQGPTSAGKTSMVEFLCKLSGNKFVRVNNHEHTDLQEYLGGYATGDDGRLEFREGVLVKALRSGHWIVLDELNLAPSDVLEALNRLLDDNRELLIPETQEIVQPHPNFMLFATQNPAGLYGGRKRLSRAFRNRFLELHFVDIPEGELEVILRERTKIAPSFCTNIVQVYKKLSLQRQATRLFEQRHSFATLRDLFRWASRPVDDRQELARHGFMLLAERVREPNERILVKRTIEETLKVTLDERLLYGLDTIPADSVGSSIVWTPAMIRLFVLVTEALKNNEPVLLVGATGCGKTQICQSVSESMNRILNIYNAHANTETGDLIGSQRPIRHRSQLEDVLVNNFRELSHHDLAEGLTGNINIESLIKTFGNIDTTELDADALMRVQQNIKTYQSLFEWSDGNLVRSMKAGEHFLLDEISLADDSVLERLNSMLEPSRSILLAEKGSNDNLVVAQPGFQFLATMNPGGDYGKRELSAALRNRLTEIWVPPLSEAEDILPILVSKLGRESSQLAPRMLDFAIWYKNNLQNSVISAIPLRSLLAWCDFIQRSSHLSYEDSFIHGALLVYVDSLGTNPAGLISNHRDLESHRIECLEKLQSLAPTIDVLALYNEVPRMHIDAKNLCIGPFSIQRASNARLSHLVFDVPTTLRNIMRVVRALQMSRPLLLEGDPGVGKTAMITALAEVLGKTCTRINLSDQTDLMDLFGADVPSEDEEFGRFAWRDGPLLQAMQSGGWVLLDEMNLASQSVLEGLNACLDHRKQVYIAELDRSFTCHPDFTLFAAQNSHQQGGGRKGLPASFINRFTVVYTDPFEREDMIQISQRKHPELSHSTILNVIDTVIKVRQAIRSNPSLLVGGPWELNLRDINRWFDLGQECDAFELLISQRFRTPQARVELGAIRAQMFGPQAESSLFRHLSTRVLQIGTSFMERNAFLQESRLVGKLPSAYLPYARSAMVAIGQSWPLLLVGPSGSGKTFVIQYLAAVSGIKLIEFSMNSDVDTMDLIGGFEQYDPYHDACVIQSSLCKKLIGMIFKLSMETDASNRMELKALLFAYEKISTPELGIEQFALDLHSFSSQWPWLNKFKEGIDELVSKSKLTRSQFVWNDGVLVDAMKEGAWLVLDNANMCNAAVLDRLNSLLEPNGTLVISEQHNSSDQERVVVPHRNFRIFLTMDPKYGELSRAMRNRSIELFMDAAPQASQQQIPCYSTTACISSLRDATACHFLNRDVSLGLEPAFELLSAKDKAIAHDFVSMLLQGCDAGAIDLQLKSWSIVSAKTHDRLQSFYNSIIGSASNPAAKLNVSSLSQLPIVNDGLLSLSPGNYAPAELFTRGLLQEVHTEILNQRLVAAMDRIKLGNSSQKSILDQSALAAINPVRKNSKNVLPAFSFLKSFINTLVRSVSSESCDGVSLRTTLLSLAEDLFALFERESIDPGLLQAHLQVLQDTASATSQVNRRVGKSLAQIAAILGKKQNLQQGQSLQRMWWNWKPTTAESLEHLEAQLSLENLIVDFSRLSKRLPHTVQEIALISSKITAAYYHITALPAPQMIVKDLEDVVGAISTATTNTSKASSGRFTPVFDWILRQLVLQKPDTESVSLNEIALYSDYDYLLPISRSESKLVQSLRALAFLSGRDCEPQPTFSASAYAKVVKSLIRGANTIEQEPLTNLSYLQQETKKLSTILSKYAAGLQENSLRCISDAVIEVVMAVLDDHRQLFSEQGRKCLGSKDGIFRLQRLSVSEMFERDLGDQQYFPLVYERYFQESIAGLETQNPTQAHLIGQALIKICLGILLLFVPDQFFDPATYPLLVNERCQMRVEKLRKRISCHKRFQQHFTGQTTSMFIRMYESDLEDVDHVLPTKTVLRPLRSAATRIQEEFSNLNRSILQNPQLINIFQQGHYHTRQQVKHTASAIVQRLKGIERAYDDILKPVSWLLESLCLGIQLVEEYDASCLGSKGPDLLRHIPLVQTDPHQVLHWTLDPNSIASMSCVALELKVEHIKLIKKIEYLHQPLPYMFVADFILLTEHYHDAWKNQVSKDRADAESQSRYYAYRGADENIPEEDLEEMQKLFATYIDDNTDERSDSDESQQGRDQENEFDTRSAALMLATVHCQLYNDQRNEKLIENTMTRALEEHSKSTQRSKDDSLVMVDLLPAILTQLDVKLEAIVPGKSSSVSNIYTDTDAKEVQDLIEMVQKIQNRFEVIALQWHEHAIPVEVLNCCDELLSLKIQTPIIKLMTKTEKLLENVAEWQSVASREWSVPDLMQSLIAKIISWRRLELLSWSNLLDTEQHNNEKDAQAWYFIAYEAVIHNTIVIVQQELDTSSYCTELTKTLEQFLKTTTLGQFSFRLHLLDTFSQTLHALSKQDLRYIPIVECLHNICGHYARYNGQIQQVLRSGRVELEKDIKEQIQLASWKDVNVRSLRDSAKRSHHKLFKVVKKYRALLAQSVTNLQVAAPSTEDIDTNAILKRPDLSSHHLTSARQKCVTDLAGWTARPKRLTDTIGASLSMCRLYESKASDLCISTFLADMTKSIHTEATELRKETPQNLTAENTPLVKHLRERKKRLFADTLRSVTRMGVRRNLGTAELSKQDSIAAVLAYSPRATCEQDDALAQTANLLFHDVLDNMSIIRQVVREHSDDLTDGEVFRGVSLLEGFLFLLNAQRAKLATVARDLHSFSETMRVLKAIQNCETDEIHHSPPHYIARVEHLQRRSLWLREIMRVASKILMSQSRRSGEEADCIVSIMETYGEKFQIFAGEIAKQANQPPNLVTVTQLKLINEIEMHFEELGSNLTQADLRHPEGAFIIRQILPWLQPYNSRNGIEDDRNTTVNTTDLDYACQQLLDQLFVAIQRLDTVQNTVLRPAEDQGWLVKSSSMFTNAMKVLHLVDINSTLKNVLDKLQYLQAQDLVLGISILKVATPVLEQYMFIAEHLYQQEMIVHLETARLGSLLTKLFATLSKEGFCTPAEPSYGDEEKNGKLEGGTGLGDGEGAEDISKDIGADEDLSELAQAKSEKQDDQGMEKSKDAVDMGTDDLEGEMGSDDEHVSDHDENDRDSGDESEIAEEETDSVDELDPSAVDEKMWDDMTKGSDTQDKEMKSDKQNGRKGDEQTAKENEAENALDSGDEDDIDGSEFNKENESEMSETDENMGESKAEGENVDQNLQDQEILDLPDDMQIGGEEDKNEELSDEGMDDLSDVEHPENVTNMEEIDQVSQVDTGEAQDVDKPEDDMIPNKDEDEDEDGSEGHAQEDDGVENESNIDSTNDLNTRDDDNMQYEIDEHQAGESGVATDKHQDHDQQEQDLADQAQTESENTVEKQQAQSGKGTDQLNTGDASRGAMEQGKGRDNEARDRQDEYLKRLADILEDFYQRREIFTASEDRMQGELDQDVDMKDADFEHMPQDEEAPSDAHALGAAGFEEAQKIDQDRAIEDQEAEANQDLPMPEDKGILEEVEQQETIAERFSRLQTQSQNEKGKKSNDTDTVLASDPSQFQPNPSGEADVVMSEQGENDSEDIVNKTLIEQQEEQQQLLLQESHPMSMTDAATIWTECSTRTQSLSLLLTEQLRLILAPSLATKLRGDFRTGKRLNIKRIIPYIASGYKRDKIWMRRSIPSKRNYQVMIAVDDSKSMSESGADLLAFETVAMLCKSLSMLEVGEISVVSFGDQPTVRVAHAFTQPFTNPESGIEIFRNFSFNQKGTNIENLLRQSITIFQDAKLRSPSSSSSSSLDLWQLQLIVSDGHCSNHEEIRRLVLSAHEQKIMIVFVIVDAGRDSIVDLKEAVFERSDPSDENSEMRVKTKRYLEGFPFQYYVVVREVADLPGVLARLLKGWFENVVDVR